MLIIITFLDYISDYHYGFFVFYFLPIITVTYFIDGKFGIIIAFIAALAWYSAAVTTGSQYPNPFFALWNACVRLIAFLIVALSFKHIKYLLEKQKQMSLQMKKNLEALEAANRDLKSFNFTVAHDLKNPLIVINALAGILKDSEESLSAEGRDALFRILTESKRMNETVTNMLRLSRIGTQEIARKNVNLTQLVSEIVKKYITVYENKNYTIIIQPGMTIIGDEGLIRIALDNLISNAMKFTSKMDNPRIQIGILRHIIGPVYFVEDNGVGFDMKSAGKIFEPFTRLHPSREFTGTGIGLAIVRKIIERHNGKIWITSEIGKGTRVSFIVGMP